MNWKHLFRRERGQALPVAAVIMVAMVGLLAFVVDAGIFLETRRELQKAADAGALAGVIKLPDDPYPPNGAEGVGTTYANKNAGLAKSLCGQTPTPTSTAGYYTAQGVYTLTVTLDCTAGYSFGRILNLVQMPLRATATAALGSLKKPSCLLPFGIADGNAGTDVNGNTVYPDPLGSATLQDMVRNGLGYTFGDLLQLAVGNNDQFAGNFHKIDLAGSGASVYRDILGGNCQGITAPEAGGSVPIDSEPGAMTGPTSQGLLARGLQQCSGPSQPALCSTYPALDVACPDDLGTTLGPPPNYTPLKSSVCLGVAPIVPTWVGQNGKSSIGVEGFAMFFIVGWDQGAKELWGFFVNRAQVSGELGAYDPLGTIVTRMIN